ncbi:MAG: hypothetical protein DWI10_00300 [Planctomycetota bacterium]|nr:MAG: hypothetical protein DWI10_00300 [Planctomycetota bacterium]
MTLLIALRRHGAKHSSRALPWISGCEVVALESLCASLPACNVVCNVACSVACNVVFYASDLYYADLADGCGLLAEIALGRWPVSSGAVVSIGGVSGSQPCASMLNANISPTSRRVTRGIRRASTFSQ